MADPVVADIAERLLNPTAEDVVAWERFVRLKEMIGNARADIGPLSEAKRQLLGLYLLNACWMGAGLDYEPRPVLEQRPVLTVVQDHD